MVGWIKIDRGIKKHWLWRDDRKFKWWIDILLSVNYNAKNVIIGRKSFTCGRGQSLKSLETWAQEWRVSKQTVKAFFDTLERDKMIVTENIRVTTRITVCNYDTYQGLINANDNANVAQNHTQLKNTITINSNSKEDIGGKDAGEPPAPPKPVKKTREQLEAECDIRQQEFKDSLDQYVEKYGVEMMKEFLNYWKERNKTKSKMRFEMEKTWDTKLRLIKWNDNNKKWKKPAQANAQQEIDPKLQKLLDAHL